MRNAHKREMLKMARKSGTTETITVEGIDYTLQHPGVRAGVQLRDRSKDMNGNMIEEKLYTELMKHVIVEPKVNWDTVEEIGNAAFTELMKEASTFLMG